jgi:outer membrane protein assembly factor BamA
MRSAGKRRLRRWAFVLVGLSVLTAAVILLFDSAWVKRRLFDLADRKLRADYGLSLRVGRSTLRLASLSASLYDVRLVPVAAGARPLRSFTASEVSVDLAWSSVVAGRLHIQSARLVKPRVEVEIPAAVERSAAGPGPPSGPSPPARNPLSFRVDRFVLSEGSVIVAGSERSLAADLEKVEIELRYRPEVKRHWGRLACGGGRVGFGGGELPIRSVASEFGFDDDEIGLERFQVQTDRSSLDLKGSVRDYRGRPSFEAELGAAVDLAEWPGGAAGTPPGRGRLEIEARAAGDGEDIRFSGWARGAGLKWGDLPEASVRAAFEGDPRRVELTELVLEIAGARLDGRGEFRPPGAGESRLELSWKDLDLIRLAGFVPGGPAVSASVEGDLRAAWGDWRPEAVRASGRISFHPDESPGSGPALPLRGTIEFGSSERGVEIKRADLRAAGTELTASGLVGWDRDIRVRVRAACDDLASAARSAAAFGVPAALSEVGGRLRLDGWLEGPLPRPSLGIEVDAEGLSWRGLAADSVRAAVSLDRAAATLSRLEAKLGSGTVTARGRLFLDAAGRPSGRMDGVSLTLTGLPLEAFAPLLPETVRAGFGGVLDAGLDASGRWDRPRLDFRLKAAPLRVGGLRLPLVAASGRVDESGLIAVDEWRIDSEGGTIAGDLSFDREHGEFSVKAGSPGLDLAAFASLVPGRALTGRIVFNLESRGPLERPVGSFRLDGEGVEIAALAIPVFGLDLRSDGTTLRAVAEAPDSGVRVEAELPFRRPYVATGKLNIERILLGGLLPPGMVGTLNEPFPLSVRGTFSVPVGRPEGFAARLDISGARLGKLAALSGGRIPSGWDGEVGGRIEVGEDPAAPGRLTVAAEIERLRLDIDRLTLENKAPIRVGFRDGVLELKELRLAAADSEIAASGFLRGLPGSPELDGRLSLDLDASLAPHDLVGGVAGGRLKLALEAQGPLSQPRLRGEGRLTDGFFQPDDFPLTVSDGALRLEFRDDVLFLTEGRGLANGGPFEFSGRAELADGFRLKTARLDAEFKGLRLNFPPGLISLSEGRAGLEGDGRTWTLGGNVRIVQGSFREDIYPGGELLGFSRLPLVEPSAETPAYYYDFKLDLSVATTSPFIVRDNMADLGLDVNLRIGGTLAAPLLTGRVSNVSVGGLVFGERDYTVETARVEFLGRPTVSPNVEIVAHTRLRHRLDDLDITLRISGTAPELTYDLTSSPPRSREELSLLLLTGKSLDEIRGNALNTLGSQMIREFASPLASPVTAGLRRLLRVDDVSLEPLNIASEADPGARLTFSKRVSSRASLTYSLDISRSQRQTWLADYDLVRNFSLRAFRRDDGSYGGGFSHSFSLGAPPPPGEEGRPAGAGPARLTEVTAEGDLRLPRTRLARAWASLRPGGAFRVSDLGPATDALVRLYKDKGYLGASVTPEIRQESERAASVLFRIEAGDPVVLVFRGDGLPRRLKDRVRDAWTGKLSEASNLAEARRLILEDLRRGRYYAAEVTTEVARSAEGRTCSLTVARNGRYRVGRFEVTGDGGVPDKAIRRAADRIPYSTSRGLWNFVNQPRLAVRSVLRELRSRGFARAAVDPPRVVEDKERRRLDIRLHVEAGPLSRVRSVTFAGNALFGGDELRRVLVLTEGRPFDPERIPDDQTALLSFYHSRGYGGAEVDAAAVPAAAGADQDLVYTIREGVRRVVAGFEIRGRSLTRESFILKTSGLKPGEPLSLERLALGQKKLYDTGAFSGVSVYRQPQAGAGGGSEQPETVMIDVREAPYLSATYGVRYNSEEKLEGFGEVAIRNLLGSAQSGRASYRQNARQRDARVSLEAPGLFGLPVRLLSSFYSTHEVQETFTTDETGWTLQGSLPLPFRFSLSTLLRLDKIHSYEAHPLGPFPFDISLFLPEIEGVLVRDTRDDRLDPHRGLLLSLALTYSPSFLRTDLPYISAFGQFAFQLSFGPGLVWASGLRVGLADAYDQVLISSRRFYAGGGNSIRGFKQDRVGPIDPYLDTPEGGQDVIILNQELRFPIFKTVSGAVFYDAGNVFETAREMRLKDFRHSLGLGLRIAGPLGLVRADYGFNLAPRPGESRGVFYLSIGQAF